MRSVSLLLCWTLLAALPAFSADPKKEEPKRADHPGEAAEFYRLKRAPVGQTAIPVERYVTAREQMNAMEQYSTRLETAFPSQKEDGIDSLPQQNVLFSTWENLGPGNVGGRTRALIIHPTNPSVMYAGGVAGGVWKTIDGGLSWAPLNDLLPNLAIASLAMDPTNPNVIYAGTGEGFFNGDSVRGAGIFKTSDGGATWTHLAATQTPDFHYVNDLVVSKNGTHNVYAATRTGVWRSTNGGGAWTRVRVAADGTGCTDLAARTDTATDFLYAACTVFKTTVNYETAILRNIDAGGNGTWQQVYTEDFMGRTSLAIAPSNQSVVYAMSATFEGGAYYYGLLAVFRSTSNGDSWTAMVRNTDTVKLNTILLSNTLSAANGICSNNPPTLYSQGWYDNVIAVDPTNQNRVWAGGVDLFRSDDAGANWGIASYWFAPPGNPQFAHGDHHVIAFHPSYNGTTNKTMFVGNDGGIFRTNDAGASVTTGAAGQSAFCNNGVNAVAWTSLNANYGVTQFYHGLPYPDGTTYFGGTQDNGTVRGTDSSGAQGWSTVTGGDGGYVAIEPFNSNVIYISYQNWDIQKSTNGGASFTPAKNGISGDFGGLFITPFVMDAVSGARLYTGGTYIWRTLDSAASWQRASTALAGRVSALAVAPSNPNRVLVGTDAGWIYRSSAAQSTGASTNWASALPQGGYVSSVTFDPTNEFIAYATYSTFGGQHVWRTTDGGASWTSIDSSGSIGLPDIPAHTLVVDPVRPSRLYVGTDLGIFISRNSGLSWAVENTGFPNVITESLSLKTANPPTLYAFTHGRGAWRVPTAPCDTPTFQDVPSSHWAYPQIETIADAGITIGCSPGNFCPAGLVTRAEMAVFLVRAQHGPGFLPPPATGVFTDVAPSYWAAAFIEQLRRDGITAGCSVSPLQYCPTAIITRTEMAVFLLRLRHGAAYMPPPATGMVFTDVPASYWGAAWIEQLKAEGLTGGCNTGGTLYCPTAQMSRAEMAVFLARERGLTFCQN
ncbi:MAG: S-layer homology domain-containing protein [Thermoanaerobaculia bacterium]